MRSSRGTRRERQRTVARAPRRRRAAGGSAMDAQAAVGQRGRGSGAELDRGRARGVPGAVAVLVVVTMRRCGYGATAREGRLLRHRGTTAGDVVRSGSGDARGRRGAASCEEGAREEPREEAARPWACARARWGKPATIVSVGGSGTLRCYGGKACGSRRLSEIARRVCSCAVETGCYGGPEQKCLLSLKKRKGERQRSNASRRQTEIGHATGYGRQYKTERQSSSGRSAASALKCVGCW